jgi:Tfp pilus assembly protein PilO
MSHAANTRKNAIRWALAVLLVLDVALVVVNWRASASDPKALRQQKNALEMQRKWLDADVSRANNIKGSLPQIQSQCDKFFTDAFQQASSGYSSVVADVGAIAKEAGLQASAATFRQKEIANRGITEVELVATVEGDYPSLVRFINGLERSRNFYVLDSLSLANSAGTSSLKLNLQLRTYFRS